MLRRRGLALLTLLLAVAWPAAAEAGVLPLAHEQDVLGLRDVRGQVDGIVEPGDTVELVPRFRNTSGSVHVEGLSGTLSAATPGVTVTRATSPFPDADAGRPTANTATPFELQLASSMRCGAVLDLSVAMVDRFANMTAYPFRVVTGTVGPTQAFTGGSGLPLAIPNATGEVSSTISVTGTGASAAAVRVRIDALDHTRAQELTLRLQPPVGPPVLLKPSTNDPALDGEHLRGTVFTAAPGAPLFSARSAPWTGDVRAPALADLGGQPMDGTWRLYVEDPVGGAQAIPPGTLSSWSLELAQAVCDPVLQARISTDKPLPVLRGVPVQFSAADSRHPRPLTSYRWRVQLDGQEVLTEVSRASEHVHTFSTAGLHEVELTITDDEGRTDVESILFPVTDPPRIDSFTVSPAGPQPTGTELTFTAVASDVNDDAISEYRWDVDGEPGFELSTGPVATLKTSFRSVGFRNVKVQAIDGYGAKGASSPGLTVESVNRPPVARATAPAWALRDVPFTLSGATSTDPEDEALTFSFDVDGEPGCETAPTSLPTLEVTLAGGTRTLGVCATDPRGGTHTATVLVQTHRAPAATLTPATTTPRPGRSTLLTAGPAPADVDGDATTFAWDLDGLAGFERDTGTDPTTSVSWPGEGARTVRVRVTDAHGATAVAEAVLTVTNLKPTAAFTVGPAAPVAGSPVTYDAGASADPEDGAVSAYDWDLDGNGTYEKLDAGPVVQRAYPSAMTAKVGLRVKDSDGGQGTTSRTIAIAAAPVVAPPPAPAPDTGAGEGAGTGAGQGAGMPVVPQPTTPAAAVPATPAATTAPGAAAAKPAVARPRVRLVVAPRQRLRDLLKRGLRTTCRATGASVCTVRVTVDARQARKLRLVRRGRTPITVAARSGRLGAARVRVKQRLRGRLRRATRLKVVVSATVADAGGRATVTRTVTLRR